MRAARRISVSPSGPPVSATTTRSRASQVRVDVVLRTVLLQAGVDPVGQPEQREFAQGGQVADPEVVAQGSIDLVRRVDVAVRHPAAQRLRGHVDQLDLVGGPDHPVRHGLLLRYAGDLLDHVVDRLEVLDVDRRDHVDPGGQQLVDVLPALLVPAARHVGVRQLVDQRDLGPPGQHGVEVHLGEAGAAVVDDPPRHDLQAVEHLGGVLPAVGLDEADHHVGAAVQPPLALAQHLVGLARRRARHPGRSADARGRCYSYAPSLSGRGLTSGAARSCSSVTTFTRGSPRKPSVRPSVFSFTSCLHLGHVQATLARDPVDLQSGVRRADVRVEAAATGGDRVRRDLGRVDTLQRRDGLAALLDRREQVGVVRAVAATPRCPSRRSRPRTAGSGTTSGRRP